MVFELSLEQQAIWLFRFLLFDFGALVGLLAVWVVEIAGHCSVSIGVYLVFAIGTGTLIVVLSGD